MCATLNRATRTAVRLCSLSLLLSLCELPHIGAAIAEPTDFTLRVGYQPYFAEAWSGAMIRAGRLEEGRLPAGVPVQYNIGLKGAGVLVDALRHGELDLAYLGLAPTLTVTQGSDGDDFRIIAVSSVSSDLCNVIVAGSGAPHGAGLEVAVRWLEGKRLGTSRGTCSDLFLSNLIDAYKLHPAQVLDLSPDVLVAALRDGKIDAAAIWEPYATAFLRSAPGVRLLSGRETAETSAAFLVARASVLAQRPDVIRGWLRAERAAQQLLMSNAERRQTLAALQSQTRTFDAGTLSAVLNTSGGRGDPEYPFVVTPAVGDMLQLANARMARRLPGKRGPVRAGTVADGLAREVLNSTEASRAVRSVSR